MQVLNYDDTLMQSISTINNYISSDSHNSQYIVDNRINQ